MTLRNEQKGNAMLDARNLSSSDWAELSAQCGFKTAGDDDYETFFLMLKEEGYDDESADDMARTYVAMVATADADDADTK